MLVERESPAQNALPVAGQLIVPLSFLAMLSEGEDLGVDVLANMKRYGPEHVLHGMGSNKRSTLKRLLLEYEVLITSSLDLHSDLSVSEGVKASYESGDSIEPRLHSSCWGFSSRMYCEIEKSEFGDVRKRQVSTSRR